MELRQWQLYEEEMRLKAVECLNMSGDVSVKTDVVETLPEYEYLQESSGGSLEGENMGEVKLLAEKQQLEKEIRVQEHKLSLTKEHGGVPPSVYELFAHTQSSRNENGERTLCCQKAKEVDDEYKHELEATAQPTSETREDANSEAPPIDANKIFFKAAKGRSKKGRVYGVGDCISYYYPNSIFNVGPNCDNGFNQETYDKMRAELKAELQQEFKNEMQQRMQEQFSLMMQGCGGWVVGGPSNGWKASGVCGPHGGCSGVGSGTSDGDDNDDDIDLS